MELNTANNGGLDVVPPATSDGRNNEFFESIEHTPSSYHTSDDDGQDATPPLPDLPGNIQLTDTMILVEEDKELVRLCDRFDVVAKTRDAESGSNGRLLRITRPNGSTFELAVAMKDVAGDGIIDTLRDYINISFTVMKANAYVRDYIQYGAPERIITCVTKAGWHVVGGTHYYVSPHGTFPQNSDVVLQTQQLTHKGISTKGTLTQWQQHVAQPCAGNSRFILALCTAFAAPVLPLVCDEGGGVHFKGASSIGKTTLLLAACSVAGSPDYKQQWRTTDNALEMQCALHNHMALILDEIGQVDPNKLGDIAYMIANGQAKNRSNAKMQIRDAATWQTMLISTGELTISDKIREGGKKARAGMSSRIVDVSADAGAGLGCFDTLHAATDGASLSNQIKEASARYYGTAYPAFIASLVQVRGEIDERYKMLKARFFDDTLDHNADGQVKRVAERFAVIALAGELAIELGILPYEPDSAYIAARTCFTAWAMERGGQGALERKEARRVVQLFVESYQKSRFIWLNEHNEHSDAILEKPHMMAGYVKDLHEQRYFLVNLLTFRDEICKGIDYKLACDALKADGLLLSDADGRLTKKVKVEGRAGNFYAISHQILEGDG